MADKDNQLVERKIFGVNITTTLKLAADWERFNKMGFYFNISKEGIIEIVLYRVYPSKGVVANYTEVFGKVTNFVVAWNNHITSQRGEDG
jgi:hypothetical protein